MNKFFLAIMAFFIFAVSTNAQTQINQYTDDDFCRWWGATEKVTTELIECSSTSNVYNRIDIHRNHGVPRFGIITDCLQNVDTVWYIPSTVNRSMGGINAPVATGNSITVWWKESLFTVRIMDILTGNVVLDEVRLGQPASLFVSADAFFGSPNGLHQVSDVPNGPATNTISFPAGTSFKKDNNAGTTIDYSNLPDGLYWIYITDNSNNTIPWMVTIRKGV